MILSVPMLRTGISGMSAHTAVMKAFAVIVGQKLFEYVPQVPFPENYEMVQALVHYCSAHSR